MTNIGMSLDGGYLQPIPPNADPTVQIAAINDVINRLNAQLKSQVYADDATKRALMGYQPGGFPAGDFGMKLGVAGKDISTITDDADKIFDWDFTDGNLRFYKDGVPYVRIGGQDGMKVAQAGINVDSAPDNELIFSTDFSLFKIVDTDLVDCPAFVPGAVTTTTIPHGLGYGPLVIGFLGTSTGFKLLPTFNSVNTGGGGFLSLDGYIDIASNSTNIFINTYSAGTTAAAGFFTVRYFVLRETGED